MVGIQKNNNKNKKMCPAHNEPPKCINEHLLIF